VRTRCLFAMVAVMALVAACEASGGPNGDPDVAVRWEGGDEAWLQPAGTRLSGSLVVPDGAQLAGPVFSYVGRGVSQEISREDVTYQEVYLLVEGEIASVVDDLVSQGGGAEAFYLWQQKTLCEQTVIRNPSRASNPPAYEDLEKLPYDGTSKENATAISCAGAAHELWDHPDVKEHYEEVTPNFEQRQARDTDAPFSFELYQDLTDPDSPAVGRLSWGGWPASASDRVVVSDAPLVPSSGRGMTTHSLDSQTGGMPLVIQPGSYLAIPPLGPVPTNANFSALIAVTSNADDVFKAYTDHFGAEVASSHTSGDVRYRSALYDAAGGDKWQIELNVFGDAAWILINFSHDA